MGYMGFGLRKEDYKRKPREIFTREKELYGEHLEKYPKVLKNKPLKEYLTELEAFKNKRRIRSRFEEAFLGMAVTLGIMVIIFALTLLFMNM